MSIGYNRKQTIEDTGIFCYVDDNILDLYVVSDTWEHTLAFRGDYLGGADDIQVWKPKQFPVVQDEMTQVDFGLPLEDYEDKWEQMKGPLDYHMGDVVILAGRCLVFHDGYYVAFDDDWIRVNVHKPDTMYHFKHVHLDKQWFFHFFLGKLIDKARETHHE